MFLFQIGKSYVWSHQVFASICSNKDLHFTLGKECWHQHLESNLWKLFQFKLSVACDPAFAPCLL